MKIIYDVIQGGPGYDDKIMDIIFNTLIDGVILKEKEIAKMSARLKIWFYYLLYLRVMVINYVP